MRIPPWPDFKGYRNIELGLSRVFDLLERLEHPQKKIPPVIHLAGTNGKGSTLSFLNQIFQEAGYLTHSYSSPHLVNFNERITLAGSEISDEFLNKCLLICKNAAEQSPAIDTTFFEGITVAAFLAFSQVKADILLLETGMGGRLDATNILPEVLCSIITPISIDHADFLGNSLSGIAFEKAGIIKKNCPVIIGKQSDSALQTIEKQAESLNSETLSFSKDWKVEKNDIGFTFSSPSLGLNEEIQFPKPSMQGDHQIENAGTAITAALLQNQEDKFIITPEHIKSSLTKTFWPARLQKITSGKLFETLPDNYELYLDGGHNLQASQILQKFLKSQKTSNKKVFVILAMMKDKDCAGFIKNISEDSDKLISLEIPEENRSYKAAQIVELSKEIGNVKSVEAENFDDAFKKIIQSNVRSEEFVILICGSLYLAGDFLYKNQ